MKIKINRDLAGHVDRIEIDGWTVLQLIAGTQRNEACARLIVSALGAAMGTARGRKALVAAFEAAKDGAK